MGSTPRMSPAHLVSFPGEGEAPNRHGRTERPCWRCRPDSEPTLVRFEATHKECVRAREHAALAGACVDVAVALALELDQVVATVSRQSWLATTARIERLVTETPVQLAADARMRSWQRYLISGAQERARDQLPDVVLPTAIAEHTDAPLRLRDFFGHPASTIALARHCEILAAGSRCTLSEFLGSRLA
jgi:hypothetical protein